MVYVTEPSEDFGGGESQYEERVLKVMKYKEYITTKELENLLGKNPIEILSKLGVIYEFEPGKWKLIPPLERMYGKVKSEQPQPQNTQPQKLEQPQQQYKNYQQNQQYRNYNYNSRKYNYGYNNNFKWQSAYDYLKKKQENQQNKEENKPQA